MSILQKHLEFVNAQYEFHEGMTQKYQHNPFRANQHRHTAEKFKSLSADILAADLQLDLPKAPTVPETESSKLRAPLQLSLSPDDLEGLPQELLNELTGADRTEYAVINAIEESGGIIALDRLLVMLYKATGEIHKRESLTAKLYRMAQKNLIFNVPGKKGVYSSEQFTSEDSARLFAPMKQKA